MFAFVPCGGNKEANIALLFVRALFLARLPRTPTRLARARLVLHVIYIDRSSASHHVSRNTKYKSLHFSSGMEVYRTEKNQ